jgi:hypothetical protein
MNVNLLDWLNEGRLKPHKTSKSEITQLLAVFDRDFADAQVRALSTDRKFTTAYNAALMIAIAALVASGYRAASKGHHYWTIRSLAFTLQPDAVMIETFDKFRRKRNTIDYERIGMVSEKEVGEMLSLAKSLRDSFEAWLRKNHHELLRE